ncbi:MAG: aminofutalosine synthase MqnE [Thermodesulfobacteriota bacterium]
MDWLIHKAGLEDIYEKVRTEERLSFEDGLRLCQSSHLLVLGFLANMVRERKNGNKTYYVYNQHINYSNICVNRCRFCAFGKDKGDPEAFEMTIPEIVDKVRERLHEPITEIHIVGGIHPDMPFDYYLNMLREIKKIRPQVYLQAFTCVEIAHLAEISGLSIEETLLHLREAGLGSLPGGGAEVFSARIRKNLCPRKLSPEGWLHVAKTSHRLGIPTNATILYGHIETDEERIAHLMALREVQDETGGFVAFIPLAFHPKNTEFNHFPSTTGFSDLKNIAISRLMLDNFPHIKAFWIMIGQKLAQLSLSFGADDIDGTVIEERIVHMAGAETAQGLTREELLRLIHEAGREPVERDTLYHVIQ